MAIDEQRLKVVVLAVNLDIELGLLSTYMTASIQTEQPSNWRPSQKIVNAADQAPHAMLPFVNPSRRLGVVDFDPFFQGCAL